MSGKILVTGAAGRLGSVGRKVVEQLRAKNLNVRAFVKTNDDRAEYLKSLGAEIFIGDLTSPTDVVASLKDCDRAYFGMSVSAPYLEASCLFIAAALQQEQMKGIVNISQMTVSQMSLTNMINSPQQKLHWLAEQAFNWSGLPVVHVRATAFLEHFFFSSWAAKSISEDNTIRLPFGDAKTSPIATFDIARVVATILSLPDKHIGRVYELTGPSSQDMYSMAEAYSQALKRPVKFEDMDFDEWYEKEFLPKGLPDHVAAHIKEMAKLHKQNRYDRLTHDVEEVTGEKPMDVASYVKDNPELFGHLVQA